MPRVLDKLTANENAYFAAALFVGLVLIIGAAILAGA